MNQRYSESGNAVTIELLAARRELLPLLQQWFDAAWPSYYGRGGIGNAQEDLNAYANQGGLPVGVIAIRRDEVCGVAVLKAESITSHRHLSPWAAALLVKPSLRRQGIGKRLLDALEIKARELRFNYIYCGTSTAESLLQRGGWQLLERITYDGQDLGVYRKML